MLDSMDKGDGMGMAERDARGRKGEGAKVGDPAGRIPAMRNRSEGLAWVEWWG